MQSRPSNLGLVAVAFLSASVAMLAFPSGRPSAKPSEPLGRPVLTQVAFKKPLQRATTYRIVRVKPGQSIEMRSKPGGSAVGRIGTTTEFGSRRTVSVAAIKGHWLGVTATERPNGKLAWIDSRSSGIETGRTKMSIVADLSQKSLVLRSGRKVVKRFHVAIGRPGSPTPTGRFQVTDKLSGGNYGPYYGCCILALSGEQPNTPPGWTGGNRLAIHGTNAPGAIGTAASAGCLRAADSDLHVLMRRVPVGTPVFIRR
jgi:lipoprotein-anchoring transpeptidase ErfK/SrfK